MMMRRSTDQLLMPVNPLFIAGTLLVALLLNLVPLGRHPALPDLLSLALVFWAVHQPLRVGVGTGFALGVVMDVHDGALLGQHAFAYTLLAYVALAMRRRLLWFPVPLQTVQIAPLFFAAHAVAALVRLLSGGMLPGWSLMLAPLVESLLWPLATQILLAPQRRAPDPDQNRPI